MNEEKILETTAEYVKQKLRNVDSGHDWWHIQRVWNYTKAILKEERANSFTCQLAAILHDIADHKFHAGDENIGAETATDFLAEIQVPQPITDEVKNIIQHISFTKSFDKQSYFSPELAVVQDADRLDAIGAIGIARAFTYGGFRNQEIHNPETFFKESFNKEAYKQARNSTLHHFYDKLLKVKDKMNTKTGKRLAENRHEFLKTYLNQFFEEWEGLI